MGTSDEHGDRFRPAAIGLPLDAPRRRLVWATWACLGVYAPAETFYSYPHLASPGYLVDLVAMVLLATGALHLQQRGRLGPLLGGWAWSACLAWRSYFARRYSRQGDLGVYEEPDWVEPLVGVALVVALLMFGAALGLCYREGRAEHPERADV